VAIRCKSIGDDALALPALDSDVPPFSYDLRQLGTMRVFRQRGMLISYAGLNQILGVT
jgi:hypothetical protein